MHLMIGKRARRRLYGRRRVVSHLYYSEVTKVLAGLYLSFQPLDFSFPFPFPFPILSSSLAHTIHPFIQFIHASVSPLLQNPQRDLIHSSIVHSSAYHSSGILLHSAYFHSDSQYVYPIPNEHASVRIRGPVDLYVPINKPRISSTIPLLFPGLAMLIRRTHCFLKTTQQIIPRLNTIHYNWKLGPGY